MTTLGGAIPPAGNPNMIHNNNNHSNNITGPNYSVQINPITGMSQPIYSNAPNLQSPQIQNSNNNQAQSQSHRPVQDEVSLPGYSQAVPANNDEQQQPPGQSIDDNEGDTNVSGHRVGLPSSDQE